MICHRVSSGIIREQNKPSDLYSLKWPLDGAVNYDRGPDVAWRDNDGRIDPNEDNPKRRSTRIILEWNSPTASISGSTNSACLKWNKWKKTWRFRTALECITLHLLRRHDGCIANCVLPWESVDHYWCFFYILLSSAMPFVWTYLLRIDVKNVDRKNKHCWQMQKNIQIKRS